MPKGPRTLRIAFGAEMLTHYGGVYLLHRFHAHWIKPFDGAGYPLGATQPPYSVGEMFLAVYPMILVLNASNPLRYVSFSWGIEVAEFHYQPIR